MTTLSKEGSKKQRYNNCCSSFRTRKDLILDDELDALLSNFGISTTPRHASPNKIPPMDFYEAVVIFLKHLEATQPNAIALQPNIRLSELIKGVWYLRNTNGLLARIGTIKKRVFMPVASDYSGDAPIQRELCFSTFAAG